MSLMPECSMRRLLAVTVLFFLLAPAPVLGDCSDSADAGDRAYRYAQRVLREDSPAEARKYANKAEEAAGIALDTAEECECEEAEPPFYRAGRHAKRASKEKEISKVKEYAREAMREAAAGVEAVGRCR